MRKCNADMIGGRIADARYAAGMTKVDLGRRIGVSATCVFFWENNRCDVKLVWIPRIAEALGITALELLVGDDCCGDFDLAGLGERIRFSRCLQGYSRDQLGDLIAYDGTSIRGWESYGRFPPVRALESMAEALHETLEWLVAGKQ